MFSCLSWSSNSSSPLITAKPSALAGSSNLLPVLALGLGKFLDSGLAFLGPDFLLALTCGQSLTSTWLFVSSLYLAGGEGDVRQHELPAPKILGAKLHTPHREFSSSS